MLHVNIHLDEVERAEFRASMQDEDDDRDHPYVILWMKEYATRRGDDFARVAGEAVVYMTPEQAIDLRDSIASEMGGANEIALGEFVFEDCLEPIRQQDAEALGRAILNWLDSNNAAIDKAPQKSSV